MMDAFLRDLDRPRPRSKKPSPAELDLFAAVYDEAENVGSPAEVPTDRVEAVHESLTDSARHWIDLGKPIAVAVANARGTVTAETFRDEASQRGKLRPADDDRSLSYLAVMFRELVKEGRLTVARHPNGDAVKRYSKEMGNDQNVYLPKSREAAAA